MRILFVALILFSYTAVSEDKLATSFESNYLLLQKKIESLKEHGQKVNEKTREEIDALMVQMNHEHAELKRQVEKIKSLKENAKESGVDCLNAFRRPITS